ncbi:unnamed protein product [Adineta ricciae]|uniref:Uncharacterized protein n=1 Tax=Adineta ricciae TaxID=249248 RepID=A0A813XYM3_ADIRI|nr:unnamed protein product [Adineta ricciae]CAF1192383.1 unnamed protein product [Adineta ricciae]
MAQLNDTAASSDILEEMLKQGDMEFFPQLRTRIDRFVDVFNHHITQQKLNEYKRNLLDQLRPLQQATTVFTLMQALRRFFSYINGLGVSSLITTLHESGFETLMSDDTLNFLDNDDLTIDQRVTEFFNRQNRRSTSDRPEEVTALAKEIAEDIRQVFEPLKEKLVGIQAANRYTLGLANRAGKAGDFVSKPVGLIGSLFFPTLNVGENMRRHSRLLCRGEPNWFSNVANYLTDYVTKTGTSDRELQEFLDYHGLEDDFVHFQFCINKWIEQIREMLPSDRTFMLGKSVVLSELERVRKFLYAVILNKPELLQEHTEAVTRTVHNAATQANPTNGASLLPCIAYGQLPLPTDGKRILCFDFVLDSSVSHRTAENVLNDISRNFQDVRSRKVRINGDVKIVTLEVEISENIPHLIAKIISKLANLNVRSVLIGNFGLNGFRHAMNPAFNRIYSRDGRETAVGFIATSFVQSLNRGSEPYYCPNGWRRYAIDVGMTGAQFEQQYGSWPVAYHGTAGALAMTILLNGLRASGQGCFLRSNHGAVYLSPSIEYSGHPRYAKIVQIKSKYVQMVLQVRVHPKLIEKYPGTLPGAFPHDKQKADPNFSNDVLEWVVHWKPGQNIGALNGILVYGLMFRVTDEHPKNLPQNQWWKAAGKLGDL